MSARKALIVVENNSVPIDVRPWYEATSLRDTGWQVAVICPAPPVGAGFANGRNPVDLEGVSVFYFPLRRAERGVISYAAEYLAAFFAIARLTYTVWRQGRFDILHFCNPPDIFFPIAAFFHLRGARIVFDHHDLFPELVTGRHYGIGGKLLYALARATEYLTLRSADVVISTNQSYRRIAVERGRIPVERTVVVRNGPKQEIFVPVKPDPALRRGFRFMACYAGVMGHEDGVLELLASVRSVVHDLGRSDILFVLLGSGSVYAEAVARVSEWQLAKFVEMPGMIYDNLLLRRYLCTADVLLAPEPLTPLNAYSTFVKVGEYMAMGKPIVAYGLNETRYTAEEAAVYVEPGDTAGFARAIVSLLEDPDRRQRMGELGRQRFESHLAWEHQHRQLLRAYAIALEGRS